VLDARGDADAFWIVAYFFEGNLHTIFRLNNYSGLG
jgi:hypothetical protein